MIVFSFLFLTEVWLIYHVVLASGVHIVIQYFCRLCSIIGCYKIMSIIPCAREYILIAYLSYT